MSIVSNTTPLSELAKIGRLGLLRAVHGGVVIPREVFEEVTTGNHPAAKEVPLADWIEVRSVVRADEVESLLAAEPSLGRGECAAIVLAEELGAGEILIDDLAARLVAEERGLAVTGTVAAILLAKRRGFVASVREPLDDLIAHGTRISQGLYRDALASAGEASTS